MFFIIKTPDVIFLLRLQRRWCFSTRTSGLWHQQLLLQIQMFLSTRRQHYFVQLSHFIYHNMFISLHVCSVIGEGEESWEAPPPLTTSDRWLCSSLVCKNETEFGAKLKKNRFQQLVLDQTSWKVNLVALPRRVHDSVTSADAPIWQPVIGCQ